MTTQTVTGVTPVRGADVIQGDRLWTETGFTSAITHFVTPPDGSFAAGYYGVGVRIPFHGTQPIMRPIPPKDQITIKTRAA